MKNVTKENCNDCPVFKDEKSVHQENMIKYNICHRRDMTGCFKDEKK